MNATQQITYETRRESRKKIILTADNDYSRIYKTIKQYGKLTTRRISELTGIDLITCRARVTEMSTCENPVLVAVEKVQERDRKVAVYTLIHTDQSGQIKMWG